MNKKCLNCGEPMSGRADKKFCSDYCRSSYNYTTHAELYSYIKRINYILRKNWNILKDLNPNGKTRVSRTKMIEKGFNFSYHTGSFTNKNGLTYYYVYNKGYIPLGPNKITLLEKPDFVDC